MRTPQLGVASKPYYAAVRQDPGASTRDIAIKMGVDAATADYHLRRLVQAGLVVRERGGRSLAHFVAGSVSDRERLLGRVSRTTRAVYAVLQASPRPMRAPDVSAEMGLSIGAVRWAMDQLVLVGLARRTSQGACEVVQ